MTLKVNPKIARECYGLSLKVAPYTIKVVAAIHHLEGQCEYIAKQGLQ